MYKILSVLIVVLFVASGCNNKKQSKELIIPDDIHYYITQDQSMQNKKRSVEAVLNKRVNKEILNNIALNIKNSDSNTYERTFIGYFIGGEDNTQGYWATTHFNPSLKVNILGLNGEEKKRILSKKITPEQGVETIGYWLEDRPYHVNKMILYYKKNRFYLEQIFETFTQTTEMSFEKVRDGIKIVDIKGGRFGEYYLLTKERDLEFWSKVRNYYTAKKLSNQKISKINVSQMIKQWNSTAYKKEKDIRVKNELAKRKKKIEITLRYYKKDIKTYFTGITNLPKNTKIGIQLNDRGADFNIYIKEDGSFISAGFTNMGRVLYGDNKVEVLVYNNNSWQTKDILEKLKEYYGYGFVGEGHATIVKNYSF